MPQIIPIRDLKKTSTISDRCHTTQEPIFITKNGYGDMVIMRSCCSNLTIYHHLMVAICLGILYNKKQNVVGGEQIPSFFGNWEEHSAVSLL